MTDDPIEKGLAEAFGAPSAGPERPSVLDALRARTGSRLNLHLDSHGPDEAPVRVTDEAKELRDPSGRYQVLGEIGRGGVGVVFKGRDTDLGRDVAMKVLRDEYAARPDVLARFVEEAQLGGQLQHPGIVPVYELGLQAGERPYFAMKLVKGETLAAELARRADAAQNRRRLLGVFEQVCQTVAYAHARHVVHRDLKPANVMIGAFGEVQVVDWGFAKVLAKGRESNEAASVEAASERSVIETVRSATDSGSQSLPGSMMGTPAYMPPEQAQGDVTHVDRRSDVFSLGAILCEILTGAPPYREEDGDLVRQAANAELEGAHARLAASGADAALIALCKECLSPAGRARPESAAEVAERVSAYLTSVEERAHRAEIEATAARYRQRTTLVAAAAAVVVLALGAGTWIWTQGQAEQRRAEATQRVASALSEASAAHGKAQAQADGLDLALWDAAVTAARRATELADSDDVDATARGEAATALAAIEAQRAVATEEAARRARDAAMLARLVELRIPTDDDVREVGWLEREHHRLNDAYGEAFAEYLGGVPLRDLSIEAGATVLAESRHREELAMSLLHWSLVHDAALEEEHVMDPAGATHLREIAARMDPGDPWRAQLHALLPNAPVEGDRLRALAANADEASLSAAGWRVLSFALWRAGDEEATLRTLRRGQELHPQDFDLGFALAVHLERLKIPRWEEVVVVYRILHALRPTHDETLHRLALALIKLERFAEAERVTARLLARDPDNVHWMRHLAASIKEQGRLHEALVLYQRTVELGPQDSQNHKGVGTVLDDMGQTELAIEAYRRALEVEPWNQGARSNLGNALRDLGRLEEAIEVHRATVAAAPEDNLLLNNLGFVLAEYGELEEAIDLFRRALEVAPSDTVAATNLGDALYGVGRDEEARAAFARALEFGGDPADVYFRHGDALHDLGRPDEAIPWYERAIEFAPDDASSLNNLGLALIELGRPADAVEHLRVAIRSAPDLAAAHGNLGLALSRLGRFTESVESWRRAIALNPAVDTYHHNLGVAWSDLGRTKEAIESYRAALEINEDRRDTLHNLGAELARAGRAEEALPYYERAAALDPKGSLSQLALTQQDLGRYPEAIESMLRAIELDPDNAEYHNDLGVSYLRSGRREDAIASFERAMELNPRAAFPYVNLGDALRAAGRFEEASAVLREALELQPESAQAHGNLGLALAGQGDREAAIESYLRAIELDPDHGPPRVNLGNALFELRRYDEAREAYAGAADVFGRQVGAFAEQWAGFARSQIDRIDNFSAFEEVLAGERQAASSAEWADAIDRAYDLERFREIVALTEVTLSEAPHLPGDESWHTYNSACAAALLADAAQGADSAERAHLRALALAWLLTEVERWESWLGDDERAADASHRLRRALEDPDFASVRGDALGALPESEREPWLRCWQRIEVALTK